MSPPVEQDGAVVPTSHGKVEGRLEKGILAFRGIRYAAAPFGRRRFCPPVPPSVWGGVRPALEFSPSAPQPDTLPFLGNRLPVARLSWGTDCLCLNIFSPEPGAVGLPVMVWIHGGSYVRGSGADERTEGGSFARDGIVCVTLNYRLGVDGFLALPGRPPNLGLQDQLAALHWVQENIAAFGGDPSKVTVFGSSAGAGSIAAIASSRTRGLFTRVILQSAPLTLPLPHEDALELGLRVLRALTGGKPPHDARQMPLTQLMRMLEQFNDAFRESPEWGPYRYFLTPFRPVVDGDLVQGKPRRASAFPPEVDVLVGSNRDEARFFLAPTDLLDAGEEELEVAQRAYGLDDGRIAAAVQLYRGLSPGERLAETVTNELFRAPAVRLAEAHASNAGRVFAYEFAWSPPGEKQTLRAAHALELPFVFRTLDRPASIALVGCEAPAELAERMHRCWCEFARCGDPGWPAFDTARRATMVFSERSTVRADPRERHRPAWSVGDDHR